MFKKNYIDTYGYYRCFNCSVKLIPDQNGVVYKYGANNEALRAEMNPCLTCDLVVYCSKDCMKMDSEVHISACPILKQIEDMYQNKPYKVICRKSTMNEKNLGPCIVASKNLTMGTVISKTKSFFSIYASHTKDIMDAVLKLNNDKETVVSIDEKNKSFGIVKDLLENTETLKRVNYNICTHTGYKGVASPSRYIMEKMPEEHDTWTNWMFKELEHIYKNFEFLVKYWLFHENIASVLAYPKFKSIVGTENMKNLSNLCKLLTKVVDNYTSEQIERHVLIWTWLKQEMGFQYKDYLTGKVLDDIVMSIDTMYLTKGCTPNVIVTIYEGSIYLHALRDIAAGQELIFSENPLLAAMDYKVRTRYIEKYRLRPCNCIRCASSKHEENSKENKENKTWKFVDNKTIDYPLILVDMESLEKDLRSKESSVRKYALKACYIYTDMLGLGVETDVSNMKVYDLIQHIRSLFTYEKFKHISLYKGMITSALAMMRTTILSITKGRMEWDLFLYLDVGDLNLSKLIYYDFDYALTKKVDSIDYNLITFQFALYNMIYTWTKAQFNIKADNEEIFKDKIKSDSSTHINYILNMGRSELFVIFDLKINLYHNLKQSIKWMDHIEMNDRARLDQSIKIYLTQLSIVILDKMCITNNIRKTQSAFEQKMFI